MGCTGSGPDTIPVYGKVSFAGREPPQVCRLFFQPVEPAGATRPTVVEMGSDGTYRASAFRGRDGLRPGKYQIRVTYFDLKPGGDPNQETGWKEQQFDAGEVIVAADSRGVERNIEISAK